MKYLKTFLESQGNYSKSTNDLKRMQHTNSVGKESTIKKEW